MISPGTQLGPYEVQALVAEGSQTLVYRARDPFLERDVALKIPRQTLIDDVQASEAFVREGRACARLRHERILAVHGAGLAQGIPYLVLDWIEGGSLQARLERRGSFPVQRALQLTFDLGCALQYAHTRGVLHRDLRPAKVLLDEEGLAFLSDFGMAQIAGRAAQAQLLPESLPYAAPELSLGRHAEVGPQSDVYGLGAILYALLCGRAPLEASSVAECWSAWERPQPIASPAELGLALPAGLSAFLLALLAQDPRDRPDLPAALSFLSEELERVTKGKVLNMIDLLAAHQASLRARRLSTSGRQRAQPPSQRAAPAQRPAAASGRQATTPRPATPPAPSLPPPSGLLGALDESLISPTRRRPKLPPSEPDSSFPGEPAPAAGQEAGTHAEGMELPDPASAAEAPSPGGGPSPGEEPSPAEETSPGEEDR